MCKQKQTILILNWLVWNKTVYMYKMDLALNNLLCLMCHKTKPNETILENYIQPNTYFCKPSWRKRTHSQVKFYCTYSSTHTHTYTHIYIYIYINPNKITIKLTLSLGLHVAFSKNSWLRRFISFFRNVHKLKRSPLKALSFLVERFW